MTGIPRSLAALPIDQPSLDLSNQIDDVSRQMSTESAPATNLKNAWTLGLCAALLILFAILSYSASLTKTATFDEPLHAVAGWAIRTQGDYRIDPEDPALFTWLSALPHGSDALKFDPKSPELANVLKVHDQQWFSAINTLYRTPGNDPDAYINRSRFIFMLIGLACGGLVTWWAWKLGGRIGAFAATACYALDPNFIGHSSLVKNDVPLALVTVGLMFAIWRAGRRLTGWNLAAIVIALAAAMNVKFSGPIFFTITFIALLIRAVMNENWPVLGMELGDRYKRLFVPVGVCIIAGLLSWLAIWACYGFRYAPTKDPSLHFDFDAIVDRGKTNLWQLRNDGKDTPKLSNDELLAQIKQIPTPAMAGIIRSMEDHKLLPETWLHGFYYTYATTTMRGSFLNGHNSITGWWYFFPLCILFKTPTALLVTGLIALLAATILWVRRGPTLWDLLIGASLLLLLVRVVLWMAGVTFPNGGNIAWNIVMFLPLFVRIVPIFIKQTAHSETWASVCLLTAVVIYGTMAMSSNFNLGIRHVLPLLPFLHIAIGVIVSRMVWRWGKIGVVLVAGLGMSLAVESCSAWPDYLAFFNAPAGGWRNGEFKLSDSNLDWGQDLGLLAKWHTLHPDKILYLCYFGTADPDYYKIQHVDLPGGYILATQAKLPSDSGIIAMSVTNLQGTYMTKELRQLYAPLHKLEPREILGGTIYLYDWPLKPPTTQQ